MGKYDPLIKKLEGSTGEKLILSFGVIEEILSVKLPASARKHDAWWANSTTKDTHVWAHAWQAAGWRAKVHRASGTVTFVRAPVWTPTGLDLLKPTKKQNVMDLVRAAGVDVGPWSISNGAFYKGVPQSNPNYCYDWSFGSTQEGYVLCVWHAHLSEQSGHIAYLCDMGSHSNRLQAELTKARTDAERQRLIKQRARALAFKSVVEYSYLAGRPLKIILNVGDMRDDDEFATSSSVVKERELDTALWYVHSFADGDALIVRNVPLHELSPKYEESIPPPDSPGEDDLWREGQIRVRRGQAAFRDKLLLAYSRRCAVTGTALDVILEAAHIVPHSEGADYRVINGLLLRADIHTLFDLYHLSIDMDGRVHLSSQAMKTDYSSYEGRIIAHPNRLLDHPSGMNLASRHQRFIDKESERVSW